MMNNQKISLAVLFITIGLIIGLGISFNFNVTENSFSVENQPEISQETVDVLSRTNQAMAELVAAVTPSIVNISSTKTVKTHGFQSPFFNDPFFERFFGDQFGQLNKPREYKQSGLGSGVIVDKDGYILTNNHVIKDADEIVVKLSDKREFKGKIIGTDPKTDLAVIRIDDVDLPVINIGNSDDLKVGETVIAIGNPYGLSQTVTSGIVSATGRANVGIADYEDFIQTDAPINPGNSGGALVNIKGELVGINTAIFSTSGGYQGIGFAIPTNMAKSVMKSLIKEGKVIRGWLGVSIQPVSEDIAEHFNLKEQKGALVAEVVEDSPAEKAKLERGDVIIRYDGREVDDPDHLRNMVAATLPEAKVEISVMRDGKEMNRTVEIGEIPSDINVASGSYEYDNVLDGVSVQNLTPELRNSLSIPKRVSGVLVNAVDADSAAAGAVKKDDVIMEINRRNIMNADTYRKVVSKIGSGDGVLLLLYRNGATIYITLAGK
ncbi:MAG: DegQ family serine endoprotease [Nitrospiraceae bacterium]|nr:MAG: DegQ family serine endoprotease [Nitrospiraceae bacterium]